MCLLSALPFHGLTTQSPFEVWVAIANQARADKRDSSLVLTRYALERLLYRLSISEHADQFLLKGALL